MLWWSGFMTKVPLLQLLQSFCNNSTCHFFKVLIILYFLLINSWDKKKILTLLKNLTDRNMADILYILKQFEIYLAK